MSNRSGWSRLCSGLRDHASPTEVAEAAMRLRPVQSSDVIMNERAAVRNHFSQPVEPEWAMVKESEPFA